jgi:hypothetical protein
MLSSHLWVLALYYNHLCLTSRVGVGAAVEGEARVLVVSAQQAVLGYACMHCAQLTVLLSLLVQQQCWILNCRLTCLAMQSAAVLQAC